MGFGAFLPSDSTAKHAGAPPGITEGVMKTRFCLSIRIASCLALALLLCAALAPSVARAAEPIDISEPDVNYHVAGNTIIPNGNAGTGPTVSVGYLDRNAQNGNVVNILSSAIVGNTEDRRNVYGAYFYFPAITPLPPPYNVHNNVANIDGTVYGDVVGTHITHMSYSSDHPPAADNYYGDNWVRIDGGTVHGNVTGMS
ncbi:MAG: hypothetical protein FWH25_03910, partial [Syntrophorhabdaceae bacterium]|nr:hypothetical protein [Syntrophorhabdaceae bacterium]